VARKRRSASFEELLAGVLEVLGFGDHLESLGSFVLEMCEMEVKVFCCR
jgi:hypothetical protein